MGFQQLLKCVEAGMAGGTTYKAARECDRATIPLQESKALGL